MTSANELIYVTIVSRVDPFQIYTAKISSPQLQYLWITTDKSFESVLALLKIVELTPSKLQAALDIRQDDTVTSHENATMIILSVINLITLNDDLQNLATEHSMPPLSLEQETRVFKFTTSNKSIFTPVDLTTESNYINFYDTIEIMVAALHALKESIVAGNYEIYEAQTQALFKILDLVKLYSIIYLRFVHEVWAKATFINSMDNIGAQDHCKLVGRQLNSTISFKVAQIEAMLQNNLDMNLQQLTDTFDKDGDNV